MKNVVRLIWFLSIFCIGLYIHTNDLVSVKSIKYEKFSLLGFKNPDVIVTSDLFSVKKPIAEVKICNAEKSKPKKCKLSNKSEFAATNSVEYASFTKKDKVNNESLSSDEDSHRILNIDYSQDPVKISFTF